jgi:signal peptidase I
MPSPSGPAHKRASWRRRIVELLALVAILTSARSSLADHYRVPSGSMLPTVEIGDRIVVAKAAYGLRLPFTTIEVIPADGPERGDVAVLESPEDGTVLLKRVAAIPGDRVEVRHGRIVIDGVAVPLEQRDGAWWETLGAARHRIRLSDEGGPDYGPVRLGDDEYLVLGDNRGDSKDGRWFGPVARRAFLGKALDVYWRGAPTWRDL